MSHLLALLFLILVPSLGRLVVALGSGGIFEVAYSHRRMRVWTRVLPSQ
jgi:hypothetical protein